MTMSILLQFAVVLGAIWIGARYSGVGLGLWGAVGLLVLVVVFGVNPTSPPIDVMLIIIAVIMAASVMDAAGGIDFLVRIAERIIRANPEIRDDRRAAHHLDLHVPRRHRPHRLSAAAGDLRGGAPERHPPGAADGGRHHRVAAGDHREPGGGGDRRDDRPVRREGLHRLGPAADPDDLRALHADRRAGGRDRLHVPRQGAQGRSRVPGARAGRARSAAAGDRRAAGAAAGSPALRLHLPRRRCAGGARRLLPGPAHAARRQGARSACRSRSRSSCWRPPP